MNYKLIAMDMDGTLLDSHKDILPSSYKAMKKADEQGVYVCLSTGRGLKELNDYQEELETLSYGILLSGGCLYDFKKNDYIYLRSMEDELVNEIISMATKKDVLIQLLTKDDTFVYGSHLKDISYYRMGAYQDLFDRVSVPVEDMKECIRYHQGEVMKICIYHINDKEREKTFNQLKDYPLTLAYSDETSIEISPLNTDKGNGLLKLCELIDLPIEETIAIGDSYNDEGILKKAGLSVAMENACTEIKEISDIITRDNDHDGIKDIFDLYLKRP